MPSINHNQHSNLLLYQNESGILTQISRLKIQCSPSSTKLFKWIPSELSSTLQIKNKKNPIQTLPASKFQTFGIVLLPENLRAKCKLPASSIILKNSKFMFHSDHFSWIWFNSGYTYKFMFHHESN
ncbi:hypothetical protein LWI29_001952 [Acer saccharum]|uniref:Uncharacterized protein n=1 Tax=Acer saccharum TaxID=4024 RepID=A0AA39RPI9_ACESA|nr:hypothetical protein LWI29_001952 [Acer saccharum]